MRNETLSMVSRTEESVLYVHRMDSANSSGNCTREVRVTIPHQELVGNHHPGRYRRNSSPLSHQKAQPKPMVLEKKGGSP